MHENNKTDCPGKEKTIMTADIDFGGREPTREEVNGLLGPVVLEFGASW